MKKKLLAAFLVIIIAAAGGLGLRLGLGEYTDEGEKETEIEEGADLEALAKKNADAAFASAVKEESPLPDNMKGYIIDPETDINTEKTDEDSLKKAAESVFDKVDAILPNTVLIKYSDKKNYEVNGFNYLEYLSEFAENQGLTVILLTDAQEYFNGSLKCSTEKLGAAAEKYNAKGVLTDGFFELNEKSSQEEYFEAMESLRTALREKNIKTGFTLSENITDTVKNAVEGSRADFFFVKITSSVSAGVTEKIKAWASSALKSGSKVYGILRNDYVMSAQGWTDPGEIIAQVKLLYNYGGFAGCVMYSREKLSTDDNNTATSLYSYNEYFNDVDYTALTYKKIELKDDNTLFVQGTTDKNYPVHIWCSAQGQWHTAQTSGDDGLFSSEIPLREGENKVVVKHKNAMYTYYIDKPVDIIASYSAAVNENKVTVTVKAKKGSEVYASLANTVLLRLQETGEEENGYCDFTGEYELRGGLLSLSDSLISYMGIYNGLSEKIMCGEEAQPTPYSDNGLGRENMCVVTRDYAETTSAASEDDTSDPTCTPQLSGSYGYVNEVSVNENDLIYTLNSGMKIHAAASRLIIGGYVLPDNSVNLESVSYDDGDVFTFSFDYPVFIKTNLAPQEYYTGYLERIYNVESFTAEYIDIIFMNTTNCNSSVTPDFSQSQLFSKIEWYVNSEENFITLRLYLKEKGAFYGYSFTRQNEKTVFSFKNDTASLEGTVIMLDPGHGGYGSPGATNDMTVYEREIVLSIGQKTADILRKYGATVILTREEDTALFLNERVEMIRSVNPDIFVSIHCDGADAKSWLGTHTFYYKSFSMPLAESIHQQLVSAYRKYYYTDSSSGEYSDVDKGYKFYPYMVTRVEECPSVLVECGYITNEKDYAFLKDDNGQNILATAIAQGIVDYIVDY